MLNVLSGSNGCLFYSWIILANNCLTTCGQSWTEFKALKSQPEMVKRVFKYKDLSMCWEE